MKIFIFLVLWIACTEACSEFYLKAKDGSTTVGRSMDFGLDTPYNIISEPKDTYQDARVPRKCKTRMSWRNKYSLIKIAPVIAKYLVLDGLNDQGLSIGGLYLPDYCVFDLTKDEVTEDQCDKVVSQYQLISYMLALYKSVADVEAALNNGTFPLVWGEWALGKVHPYHYSITDKTGKSIIIEYTAAGRTVYQNTIGVLTNSPPYDFHMTNLKNYVHITKYNRPPLYYGDGMSITAAGEGTGFLGLPGDFTPVGRFIRTVAMVQYATPAETSVDAVNQAFHILSAVDITKGVILSSPNKTSGDFTIWAVVKDLDNLRMYYRGYNYISIKSISLNDIPTDEPAKLKLDDKFLNGVIDVTNEMVVDTKKTEL